MKNQYEDNYFKPLGITVVHGNVDLALRKFKSLIKDSRRMIEVKERQAYKKPSELRKEKRKKQLFKKRQLTHESY